MRMTRIMVLVVFAAFLLFLCLLEEKRLRGLSYRRGVLLEEVDTLEKENADLRARLEKEVAPGNLKRMAHKLGLAQEVHPAP